MRERIRFRWQATNAHGIHSPFVYNFLTQGLYQARKTKRTGKEKRLYWVLKALQTYFNNDKICAAGDQFSWILSELGYQKTDVESCTWLLTEDPCEIKNKTTIILANPRKSESQREFWAQLQSDKSVSVTIDFFDVGLAFKKPGQVKEHFKIRL